MNIIVQMTKEEIDAFEKKFMAALHSGQVKAISQGGPLEELNGQRVYYDAVEGNAFVLAKVLLKWPREVWANGNISLVENDSMSNGQIAFHYCKDDPKTRAPKP